MRSYSTCFVLLSAALGVAALAGAAGCEEAATDTPDPDAGPSVVAPEAGSSDGAVVSTCTPPTGPGTVHSGTLADSETWTEAGSPHIIEFSLTIGEGKTLTIEPCAVVRIGPRMGVLVEGKLIAEGAADKPIAIEGSAPAEPWSVIEVRETGELRLVHTSVEGGGFPNGSDPERVAMLDIRGAQGLHADHLTLKNSASLGLLLREGGSLSSTSRDLTITGGASSAMSTWANTAGTVPSGSYTGNKVDEIVIDGLGNRDAIQQDMTIANRGVPYRVRGASMHVAAAGATKATLTIEPGVTIAFAKDSRLLIDDTGAGGPSTSALRAVGTAAQPIVFTSAEATPAAGSWVGILFEGQPSADDRLDHARIAYAGGSSGVSSYDCPSPANQGFTNHGAVVIYGGQPASAFITNTTFESSAGDGIVRGWTGEVIDFLPSNTFSGITRCNQTYPQPAAASCPNPAPCPNN